jgi:hypothetical protein
LSQTIFEGVKHFDFRENTKYIGELIEGTGEKPKADILCKGVDTLKTLMTQDEFVSFIV